jgi:spore coat protein CotH
MDQLLTTEAVNMFLANEESLFSNGLTNYWYYDWPLPRFYIPWDLDDLMSNALMDIYTGGPDASTAGTPYQIDILVNQPVFQAQYRDILNELLAGSCDQQEMFDLLDRIEGVIGAEVDADPFQDYAETAAQHVVNMKNWLTQRIASIQMQLYKGDFDLDQDSDLFDYGAFMVCYTGDAPAECASQPCQDAFDFDNDCDVDETDYGRFFDFFDGP